MTEIKVVARDPLLLSVDVDGHQLIVDRETARKLISALKIMIDSNPE